MFAVYNDVTSVCLLKEMENVIHFGNVVSSIYGKVVVDVLVGCESWVKEWKGRGD